MKLNTKNAYKQYSLSIEGSYGRHLIFEKTPKSAILRFMMRAAMPKWSKDDISKLEIQKRYSEKDASKNWLFHYTVKTDHIRGNWYTPRGWKFSLYELRDHEELPEIDF